jgi:hypothetical protein
MNAMAKSKLFGVRDETFSSAGGVPGVSQQFEKEN